MKQIKYFLLSITLLAFVTGCSKKSNTTPTATISASLSFNGTPFNTTNVVGAYSKSQNALQVIATFSSTSVLYIAIPSGVKVGTFDAASNQVALTFSNAAGDANTFFSTTGTVVITSFTSTQVSGTYQFTGETATSPTNSAVISSGKFTANYTTQ